LDDISTEIQGVDEGYMFILANFPSKNPVSTTTEERNWTMNRTCFIWIHRRKEQYIIPEPDHNSRFNIKHFWIYKYKI
jgi:hypothetical protein